MTLQQLSYIVEISKCGSISKAARKLFLSQSGISTSVGALEEDLGIRLFDRSNRGVEFTPEGKEFLSYAVSLLEQKDRIESLYRESRAAAPARLSVSTQRYPFTEDAFLRLLQRTDERRYRFSIKETGLDTVVNDVADRTADIGVIFLTDLTEKLVRRMMAARDIGFHSLAAVPPCVYVRRGHPLANQQMIAEEELTGYPCVSFEHAQGEAADFSEEYRIVAFDRPDRTISVSNRTTAMNVLASTDAFTTGSGLLVRELADPRVVSIPLKGHAPVRLGWIYPRYARLIPMAEQFVALLKESVAESVAYTQEEQARQHH